MLVVQGNKCVEVFELCDKQRCFYSASDIYFSTHTSVFYFGFVATNSQMLRPDNFVQDATSTQGYNRFAYAYNNPLKYTDPSGEIIFTTIAIATGQWWALPMAIGADIGMWQGGTLANKGEMNPLKWDYSSGKTWGYMLGGAIVGGASGYFGGEIAASGGAFANTFALMYSSALYSMGTAGYTGFQTDVTMSFGVGSVNFSKGEVRGLWNWKDLSTGERIGYTLGAMANISDLYGLYTNAIANRRATSGPTPDEIPDKELLEKISSGEIKDPSEISNILGTQKSKLHGATHYMGPSKTGWNPRMMREVLKPNKNLPIDEFSYQHDVAHFERGTEGLLSSILSTDRATMISNVTLFRQSLSVINTPLAWKAALFMGVLITIQYPQAYSFLIVPHLIR
ncbi:MAG: hypothetical protein KatS3mg027_0297 [Bacteroidia bacterium]|nr:MAG: hypothetical protein KatS3mg027_0297 [Bacteroidia bacterium]